jgi:hypothetical protein
LSTQKQWKPEWAIIVVAKGQVNHAKLLTKICAAGLTSRCNVALRGRALNGKGVAVAVRGPIDCTNRFLHDLEAQGIADAGSYSHYQELTIKLRVPSGLPLDASPLVLDAKTAKIVYELERRCGPPQVHQHGRTQTWMFNYHGNHILYYALGSKNPFTRGFNFDGNFIDVPPKLTILIRREYLP